VKSEAKQIAVSRSLADTAYNLQSERAYQTNGMLDDASNQRRPVGVEKIIRNAFAERSMQEKSISMKSSQPETTGDFFYVQAS
jgi:hypothetical protein